MTAALSHTIKRLPDSELEIEAEIPWEVFVPFRKGALERMGKVVEIKGFRPGHIPEHMLVQHVGETAVLEEAAKDAVAESYESIIREEKLTPLTHPAISITKLASGNPLTFKIRVPILPDIKLPDYKKIAAEINQQKTPPVEITEKDLDNAIDGIRGEVARREHAHKHKTGEPHEHVENDKDLVLPELNDAFVFSIGQFANVADFREKIRSGLLQEKEAKAKSFKREKISEQLMSNTKTEIPEVLVKHELDMLEGRLKSEIGEMGLKFEDYLTHIKKNVSELRNEWRSDATKRAKLQLIVSAIARVEDILPDPEEFKKEVGTVLAEHKDARREHVENYIAMVLTNEKVFQFLEAQL